MISYLTVMQQNHPADSIVASYLELNSIDVYMTAVKPTISHTNLAPTHAFGTYTAIASSLPGARICNEGGCVSYTL